MNRRIAIGAFVLGALAVAWVAGGYGASSPLALLMTLAIGVVYLAGALELRRFHRATAALQRALDALAVGPPDLGAWLATLPPGLRQPVRLRIDGERGALPGPALVPYLVGLLVLLGMLGTFLGMVVTLQGAVSALESTTDLPAIRAALTAPVRGLGLAFGTSVAGVAASAMLGLVAALCRRERARAAQRLDGAIATVLRPFSAAHQREATLAAAQQQAQVLPQLVDAMQALAQRLTDQHQALATDLTAQQQALGHALATQHQALAAGLQAQQQGFQQAAQAAYSGLAASVDQTLRHSLTESARLAATTIQPVVEATMADIARQTTALHGQVAQTVQQQLDGVALRFAETAQGVTAGWQAALSAHDRSNQAQSAAWQSALAEHRQVNGAAAAGWQAALAEQRQRDAAAVAELRAALADAAAAWHQQSSSLLTEVGQAHGAWQAGLAAADAQRLDGWQQALAGLLATLRAEWQAAGAQALAQQQQICHTLDDTARALQAQGEAHARSTIAEVARLTEAAAEAPRAAAELVGQLRQNLADSLARDNGLLDERGRLMATLDGLLQTIHHATTDQRAAIDAMVAAAAELLQRVGAQFTAQVAAEAGQLATAAAQITGGAADVASLGEAFGAAVQQFSDTTQALGSQLQRIEGALGQSLARSDDQLAYYVAQAREVIDLSLLSQKQIVDELQQLAGRQAAAAGEAA